MFELVFHNGWGMEYRKAKKLKDLKYVIEILEMIGMNYKLFYNCNRIH